MTFPQIIQQFSTLYWYQVPYPCSQQPLFLAR